MTGAMPAIGVILPSSNRTVERVTRTILGDYPDMDACFTRVPYAGHPADGYDLDAFRRAAAMLAESRPDIILWNATRGALLGFEPDRRLCAMIEADTGIKATTTALATVELLRARRLTRIALLAQGGEAEATRLAATFGREGIEIVTGLNLGITDNYAAAELSTATMQEKVAALAATPGIDAVLIWSTNLPGHGVAQSASTGPGVPVLDSATIGTIQALTHVRKKRADAAETS